MATRQPQPEPTASPHHDTTGPQVSNRAALVIGFVVGGAALVALAEVAPQAAIGMTTLLGLGVVLMHPDEISNLSDVFVKATGH